MAGYEASAEHELFYRGYGEAAVNDAALAFHRYERVVQDIVAYCDQLLLHQDRAADREPALERVKANFEPDGTLDRARHADPNLGRKHVVRKMMNLSFLALKKNLKTRVNYGFLRSGGSVF